jgi:hypothetical protein
MGNSKHKINKTEECVDCNVLKKEFKLTKSPVSVQLTVHINNLLITYGSHNIIPLFKDYLFNPTSLEKDKSGIVVQNIIRYYGIKTCQDWFTLIYGWNFTQKTGS